MSRKWSDDEIEYLKEYWGTVSFTTMSKNLNNRTPYAIKKKAYKLGLPAYLHSSEEYITFNQLYTILHGKNYDMYKVKYWIESRKLPISYKKTKKRKTRIVYFDDFWKWAKENRTFIDFSNLEKYALGYEPEWVEEQRRADIAYSRYNKKVWTDFEDKMLKSLLKLNKYTCKELSERLNRTEDSIGERMVVLNIAERPVKSEYKLWQDSEEKLLKEMVSKGYKPDIIAKYITNRTARTIKNKIRRMGLNGTLKKTEANVVFS